MPCSRALALWRGDSHLPDAASKHQSVSGQRDDRTARSLDSAPAESRQVPVRTDPRLHACGFRRGNYRTDKGKNEPEPSAALTARPAWTSSRPHPYHVRISAQPEKCMPNEPDQRSGAEWLQSLSDDDFRELRRAIRHEAERRGLTQQRERSEGGGGQGRRDREKKT